MPITHPTQAEHAILYDYYLSDNTQSNKEVKLKYAGHHYIIRHDNDEFQLSHKKITNFLNFKDQSTFIRDTLEKYKDFATAYPDLKYKKAQYSGICFSGGGAKGLAYAGIMDQLDLSTIEAVSGASAGALTALMVAIGLSATEIQSAIMTEIPKVTNETLGNHIKKQIIIAFYEKYEQHAEDFNRILNLPENHAREQRQFAIENITFGQLDQLRELNIGVKELYITTSLYMKMQGLAGEVKLCAETTPDIPIYKAALASAALPLPWIMRKLGPLNIKPVKFSEDELTQNKTLLKLAHLGGKKGVSVRDGGIANNIPYQYLLNQYLLKINNLPDDGIELDDLSELGDLSDYNEKGPGIDLREDSYYKPSANHTKSARNPLILSFKDHLEFAEKPLGLDAYFADWLLGEPSYQIGHAQLKFADKLNPFYIDTAGIGTTDVKTGLKIIEKIIHRVRRGFHFYYYIQNRDKTLSSEAFDDKALNLEKYPRQQAQST